MSEVKGKIKWSNVEGFPNYDGKLRNYIKTNDSGLTNISLEQFKDELKDIPSPKTVTNMNYITQGNIDSNGNSDLFYVERGYDYKNLPTYSSQQQAIDGVNGVKIISNPNVWTIIGQTYIPDGYRFTNHTYPSFIIDLGEQCVLTSYYWRDGGVGYSSWSGYLYKLEVSSDNNTYTTIFDNPSRLSNGNGQTVSINDLNYYRYVRVTLCSVPQAASDVTAFGGFKLSYKIPSIGTDWKIITKNEIIYKIEDKLEYNLSPSEIVIPSITTNYNILIDGDNNALLLNDKTLFVSEIKPINPIVNDLWLSIKDSNRIYQFNGTTWIKKPYIFLGFVSDNITNKYSPPLVKDLYHNTIKTIWISPPQTPIKNSWTYVSHNSILGDIKHKSYDVLLVNISPELGYQAGDIAGMWTTNISGTDKHSTNQPFINKTKIGFFTGNNETGIQVLNLSTLTPTFSNATLANWAYIFRIW